MDLDALYKSKLDDSHQAGLQAVYDAGVQAGSTPAETPAPDTDIDVAQ